MDETQGINGIKKIFEDYSLELDDSGQDLIENDGFYYEYARRIYNAGYRKLPKDKPPLLDDEEVYKQAIKKWGKPLQRIMVIEECAELIKAVSKYFRGDVTDDDLLGEVVDVQIMLNQLRVMINDESTYQRWFAYKLGRVRDMLNSPSPMGCLC